MAYNPNTNITALNGVTLLTGNGVTGTGSMRVTISSDNSNIPANIAQMNGVAVTMGSGVTGTGVQRVVLATDVALPAGGNLVGKVGIDQTTPGTTNATSVAQIGANTVLTGNGVTGTGSIRVTVASDNTPYAVKIDQTTPGTTNAVVQTPATPTAFTLNSAASTNATSVKGSAGTLYGITCSNNGAAAAFVKLYNKATAPTVGTDTPVIIIVVPITGTISLNLGEMGHRFGTGIALATTNLMAEADATAVAANQVKIMADYI